MEAFILCLRASLARRPGLRCPGVPGSTERASARVREAPVKLLSTQEKRRLTLAMSGCPSTVLEVYLRLTLSCLFYF